MCVLNWPVTHTQVACHANHILNLEKAVVERVFNVKDPITGIVGPPPMCEENFSRINRGFTELFGRLCAGVEPYTRDEFVARVPTRKRAAYLDAQRSLDNRELSVRDASVNVFIKYEKEVVGNKPAVPRLISPRSYRYLLEDGRFYSKIEPLVCGIIADIFGETTVAKGLTVNEVGSLIEDKFNSMSDPVAIGVDATRFDQHVSVQALRYQHKLQSMFFQGDAKKYYQWMNRQKLRSTASGRTRNGKLSYVVNGTRTSGDADTGGGNCLLMCAMMYSFFRSLNIPTSSIKLVNNGDDCVIITERRYLRLVSTKLFGFFRRLGFNMVAEEPVYVLEEIEFCQMRPVRTSDGYVMVRNPKRSMVKDVCCVKSLAHPVAHKAWTKAVSDCGLALAGDIPVHSAFYAALGRVEKPTHRIRSRRVWQRLTRNVRDESGLYKWHREVDGAQEHLTSRPLSSLTRYSYFLAFGILPHEQILLEKELNKRAPSHSPVCEGATLIPEGLFSTVF